MTEVKESIEVDAPVGAPFDQWRQFMALVEQVHHLDDRHTHWTVTMAGRRAEFDAKITGQRPDTRIAWTSTSGPGLAGAVDFHRLDSGRIRLTVTVDSHDGGLLERAADSIGMVRRQVQADLGRYKAMIESSG